MNTERTSSEPVSLRIQSVLYGNTFDHIRQSVASLARAVDLATAAGLLSYAEVAFGDCSPDAVFVGKDITCLAATCYDEGIRNVSYEFFDSNLGSAAGHNRLISGGEQDFVLILNPDTIVAPNLLIELFRPMQRARIGMVEARQIPIEHPKHYDPLSGETSWATTACALVPRAVIETIGGFDPETFFLYCDDVDFSWRIRLAGYRIIFQPSAVIFHDKRLSQSGKWIVGTAEEYYSAEAAMLLAYKYSRSDLAERIERQLLELGSDTQKRAATAFQMRKAEGRLPEMIDAGHRVAQFIDGFYAKHRF